MAMTLNRRTMLAAAGGLAVLRIGAAAAQARTVRATHFGGPYQVLSDIVGKPFEQAEKISVSYDIEVSQTAFAKLQTQKDNPPFDVVMVSRAWSVRAFRAGLLAKISRADLPNGQGLSADIIPAEGFGVAGMLDVVDLMVDTKQITRPVTSWFDLWRDDMKGKIMLPGATNGPTAFGFVVCLLRAVGGDLTSDKAVNEVFDRLKALKPAVRAFYSDGSQPNLLIERGDIAAAPQFAIRIANTTRTSPHIRKASPKEGVLANPYDLCIPVNAANADAARRYINFFIGAATQERVVTSLLASPVRPDVAIPADIAPLIDHDPALLFFQDEELAAAKQREILDRYTREVQS